MGSEMCIRDRSWIVSAGGFITAPTLKPKTIANTSKAKSAAYTAITLVTPVSPARCGAVATIRGAAVSRLGAAVLPCGAGVSFCGAVATPRGATVQGLGIPLRRIRLRFNPLSLLLFIGAHRPVAVD